VTPVVTEMHRVHLADAPRRQRPALFLDRDGTLVDNRGYLSDPDALRVFSGAGRALRRFEEAGYALVLVTNQSGVGRGYFGWDAYDRVAERLRETLAADGLVLDAECVCGHAPAEGAVCGWRKPAPGMILEAARRLDLDLSRSAMVGDTASDLAAADAAGVGRVVHVATGHGTGERGNRADWRLSARLDLIDDLAALSP
jgi:D-glycero-D-manno-heptose 1,7-bisphosphate phosphatase